MQVKSEVFSRFGSSVDCSSGEPLVGVGTPTVGADLCVRLSSPERSLFCGRTRRSAPTQATSARQFHSSNAVTPISVGADTQVRPYTSYVSTTVPLIKRCNTSSIIDRRTQKDLARGPTNHSRGSEGQSSERPTDARRHLIYRPLVGRTRRIYSSSPTSRQGRSSPLYTPLCPPVVRSFAPSTGGYDSSDRKRSLPPSPALVLLHNNETCNPV